MREGLQLVIRTPHEAVFDERVRAVRLPAEGGQFGLRPGQEPFFTMVEPGLIVVRMMNGLRFAASAGGLIDADRRFAELLSPFAVTGTTPEDVLTALARALAMPEGDVALRRRLGELEQRIVQELGRHSAPRRRRRVGV